MLRVQGLEALGLRALRLARDLTPQSVDAVRSFHVLLERTRALGWATAGVGTLDQTVARAAGVAEDARIGDPAYQALGFEPVVREDGDAHARWRQRLAEAVQALELAGRARERRTTVIGTVASPRGRLTVGSASLATIFPALPGGLAGLEWGDAVTTIVSLDLDLAEQTP